MTGLKAGVFDNYQPRSIIKIGDKLAIATQAVNNTAFGGLARPVTPKVFIFDPKTQKIIKEYTPLSGLNAYDVGRIRSIDGRHIIGFTNDAAANSSSSSTKMFLYIIDTFTDKIVMKKTINKRNYMKVESSGSAKIDGFHYILDDEYIYTWMNARTLVRINKNGNVEAFGVMPLQGKMAFTEDSIYFSGAEKIRKISKPK